MPVLDDATKSERLKALRRLMHQAGVDACLVPLTDEYQCEYVPDCARRLEWLTGFSGSAGFAVILSDTANQSAFFTDGRYTIQAKQEVGSNLFHLFNSGETPPEQWLMQVLNENASVGYDPKLHTTSALGRFEAATKLKNIRFKPLDTNLIDQIWTDRPAPPASPLIVHPLQYAGESSEEKRERLTEHLRKHHVDMALLTAPDSIAWLLNIRGTDTLHTPFALCTVLLNHQGMVRLYIDPSRVSDEVRMHLGNGVEILQPSSIQDDFKLLGHQKCRILADLTVTNSWYIKSLESCGAEIVAGTDPCQLPKACKNLAEITGTRAAHARDGLAVTRFLCWLDDVVSRGIKPTEMDAEETLESLRAPHPLYRGPSFSSISGAGPNGAIVHYRSSEATNRTLEPNMLYLIDSGGQYPDGTTDITRTVVIGIPTAEQKDRFTRVLKGHIAIATAKFPPGTTGSQLDTLARQHLWSVALDYDHGTGHGVGSFLSVHEGPQRISKRGGDVPLRPGMIISNEPGYYKTGEYGIRIENLVLVTEAAISPDSGVHYLGFETLTLAPIDHRLIDESLLTEAEKEWLKAYHQRVLSTHANSLSSDEQDWFKRYTSF